MSKISSAKQAEVFCGCSHEVAASERTVQLRPLVGIFDDLLHLHAEQADLSSMDYRKAEGRKVWNTLSGSGVP